MTYYFYKDNAFLRLLNVPNQRRIRLSLAWRCFDIIHQQFNSTKDMCHCVNLKDIFRDSYFRYWKLLKRIDFLCRKRRTIKYLFFLLFTATLGISIFVTGMFSYVVPTKCSLNSFIVFSKQMNKYS